MTVKLVGSTSGSVSLQAPASTSGGANRVLTLPDVNGTVATTTTAGKILQTIMVEKTDTTSHSAGSTIQDISGMTVNITPSATSSKILVTSTVQICAATGGYSFALYLMRDSTNISIGDASSNRTRATFGGLSNANNDYDLRPFTISYYDSPNTTSQVTYKWRWNNPYHSTTMYLNRPEGFADGSYSVMTSSNIIVQEIAA